jgi:NitT/TauT family transport system substrate-binding protein
VTRILGLAAAALALAVAAPAAADVPTIRVAWVVPVTNWASIIYEKKDLMRHYGLTYKAEPVHFQATPPMIAALAAGELDVADLAFSALALAIENAGMNDLRVIADEGQDGGNGHRSVPYVVLKGGPIRTIDDLKGKVLATVSPGAALDIPVRALLRRHGLETPRDYTTIASAMPNMGPMLVEHKIDFMPAVNPFVRDPKFLAATRTLFTVSDAMGGPSEFIVWTTRTGFIDKNRGAMVDFMEDALRAVRYLTDPSNHKAVVEIAARVARQPASSLDYVFTKDDAYRDPEMRPNLANLQRAIDVQYEAGFLKQKLDIGPYADMSLLDEAAKRIK